MLNIFQGCNNITLYVPKPILNRFDKNKIKVKNIIAK